MFYVGTRHVLNACPFDTCVDLNTCLFSTRTILNACLFDSLTILNACLFDTCRCYNIPRKPLQFLVKFKLKFGPVTIKDMQTPPSPPLTFDQPFMNDGECVI